MAEPIYNNMNKGNSGNDFRRLFENPDPPLALWSFLRLHSGEIRLRGPLNVKQASKTAWYVVEAENREDAFLKAREFYISP